LRSAWFAAGPPPALAKYAGSAIWGAMVYWVVALLLQRSSVAVTALVAAAIAVATEASQLVHFPWLDQVRRTTIGVLLIGRYFSFGDIVAYLAGIAAAATVDARVIRRRAMASHGDLPATLDR
jgi:hypothetical protein